MAFDWTSLRKPAPASLLAARETAHCAAQALARAARANLAPAPDDSHSALLWGPKVKAIVTQALPKDARAGLDVAKLELVFWSGGREERGGPDGKWLDAKLAAAGLEPASGVKLPYDLPKKELKKDDGLAALERWLAAAADLLAEVRARHQALHPGPVYLWPHHFDIATLLAVSKEKSIGVGISMGDDFYAQPYAYVSPYPSPRVDPSAPKLPPLPRGGHWHTEEFFGAVATADELLAQPDPRAACLAVIEAAIEASKKWLA